MTWWGGMNFDELRDHLSWTNSYPHLVRIWLYGSLVEMRCSVVGCLPFQARESYSHIASPLRPYDPIYTRLAMLRRRESTCFPDHRNTSYEQTSCSSVPSVHTDHVLLGEYI